MKYCTDFFSLFSPDETRRRPKSHRIASSTTPDAITTTSRMPSSMSEKVYLNWMSGCTKVYGKNACWMVYTSLLLRCYKPLNLNSKQANRPTTTQLISYISYTQLISFPPTPMSGVGGKLLTIIEDYFSNCQQFVEITHFRPFLLVTIEVPQVSLAGLIVFLIYFLDFSEDLKCQPFSLANDTKVLIFHPIGEIFQLQEDLDKVTE